MRICQVKYFVASLSIIGLLMLPTAHIAKADNNVDLSYDEQTVIYDYKNGYRRAKSRRHKQSVQLGVRPYYLIDDMAPSRLKRKLKQCQAGPFRKTDFSIGHRGAALQFPEHTKESYIAAARQGAGIVECDVTFTKDRELVCRHSQCDLHTTTNILAIPSLAEKCSVPFTPANPETGESATAQCCTSDITLDEYKSLCGKMDAANSSATTVEEYLDGTPSFRTDLYSACGTVLSHRESIDLFKKLKVKYTPELKQPQVEMPYEGDYTQQMYAQQMIDEYKEAGVRARKVWPQSFNIEDIRYWINNEPRFGKQAVYLDSRPYRDPTFSASIGDMQSLASEGLNIIAPPTFVLLELDASNKIVPSDYARFARAAGLDIITWTLERSGLLKDGGGFYYQSVSDVIDRDGDTMEVLDVLAQDVGVIGVFSDWPATVTYYANCMDL